MPRDLAAEADIFRSYCSKCDSYREIFQGLNGAEPLMEAADMIITGVGDAATSQDDPWFKEIHRMEGAEAGGALSQMAVGNVGGVWVSNQSSALVDDINSRWLGLSEDHLRQCANRASKTSSPGVVVLAIEREKAKIVRCAIGMANYLVISEAVAQELYNL